MCHRWTWWSFGLINLDIHISLKIKAYHFSLIPLLEKSILCGNLKFPEPCHQFFLKAHIQINCPTIRICHFFLTSIRKIQCKRNYFRAKTFKLDGGITITFDRISWNIGSETGDDIKPWCSLVLLWMSSTGNLVVVMWWSTWYWQRGTTGANAGSWNNHVVSKWGGRRE